MTHVDGLTHVTARKFPVVTRPMCRSATMDLMNAAVETLLSCLHVPIVYPTWTPTP